MRSNAENIDVIWGTAEQEYGLVVTRQSVARRQPSHNFSGTPPGAATHTTHGRLPAVSIVYRRIIPTYNAPA